MHCISSMMYFSGIVFLITCTSYLHPIYQTQSISKNLHFLHPVFQTHSIYELLYFLHPVFLNHCFLLGSISSPLYYLCTVFLLRFFVLAWKTNSAPLKFEHWVCWRLCGWLAEINLRILEFQLFFHPDQFNLSSKYWNFWSKRLPAQKKTFVSYSLD